MIRGLSSVENVAWNASIEICIFLVSIMVICLPFFTFHVFCKESGLISGGTNLVITLFQLGCIMLLYIDATLVQADNPTLQKKVAQLAVINSCAD